MKIKNNGTQLHTPFGLLDRGESEHNDYNWGEMEKMPKVAAALASKQLEKVSAAKVLPKEDDKPEGKPEGKAKK